MARGPEGLAQIGDGTKTGGNGAALGCETARNARGSGLEVDFAGELPVEGTVGGGPGRGGVDSGRGLLGEGQDRRGDAGPRHGADLLRELGDEPAVGESRCFRPGVAAGGAPGAAAVDAVDAQAAQVRDLQLPGRPELELRTPAAQAGVRTNSPRLMRADQ